MTTRRFPHLFAAIFTFAAAPAVMLGACSGDDEVNGGDATSGGGAAGPGVCLLNNCASDVECAACPDGRSMCLEAESRCVACDPNTGAGCPTGQICSPYGLCTPPDLACPNNNPAVSCTADADCAACSPMDQVCNTATGECVACTASNTTHCLSSDTCVDNECKPKCPQACSVNADCSNCGGPGNEAHACNAGKCAECSDTVPCAEGLVCENGSCIAPCGIVGEDTGVCKADEDCGFCGDGTGNDDWVCKKAFNANDPDDEGECVPSANGCSDLGDGVVVLPEPFDQATNLCSNDVDCNGVGIKFNVGAMIRDLVGDDEVLGVPINDADVDYAMGECASLQLTGSIACGICVPCEVDADCAPIDVDAVVGDLFDGSLAGVAAAFLIDFLYGDNPNHDLNFYCQPVAAGYGICAPCANPLAACGD